MKELYFQFRHEARGVLIFAQYSQFTVRLWLLCAICFDLLPSAPIWCFFSEKWSWRCVIVAKAINYWSCKSVLPGKDRVCSYQAAALLPLLSILQVNCTMGYWRRLKLAVIEAAPAALPLYMRTNQRLPAAFHVLWGDFVSKNSYWWCVTGWKTIFGE